jgi:signal transduction histidine kinase
MKLLSTILSSFLYSGFEFSPKEELLKVQIKLFNIVLSLVFLTATTITLFNYYMGEDRFHLLLTIYHALITLGIIFLLRRSKKFYYPSLIILLVSFLIIFGIAFYNLNDNHASIQVFSLAILVMFLLGGRKFGFITYGLSFFIILTIHLIPGHVSHFSNMEIFSTLAVLTFTAIISSYVMDKVSQETGILVERVEDEVKKNRVKDEELLKQSKLAQMGELLSIISHQWKQPLSTISAYTSDSIVGLELGDNPSKAELKSIYMSIEKQVNFLSKTMDDFRHFYNPNKTLKLMYMPHVIEQAVEIIDPEMTKGYITIHKSFHFNMPLHSYPNEITQAMLILLKNAKDAHGENKKNRHKRIHISGYQEKDAWVVEVRDNAGGISKENLPNIFDQYFSTKESSKGTGLGLYLCRNIIEQSCRGKIEVELIDDGTMFRLTIPSQE